MKNLIHSILILNAVLMSTTGNEEVIYAQVGDTVTLKMPTIATQKKYVYWHLDTENGFQLAWYNPFGGKGIGEGWKDKLSLTDDSLTIRNIQQEHFRTFISKVESDSSFTTKYKVVKLNVFLKPSSPLLPGESLTLDCDVNAPQDQKPQIYWLNPQEKKVPSNKGASGGKITMRASSQDNGQWTCVVSNVHKAKVSVTVVDLSPAPSHPQYTSKFSPLTIPCSIRPLISWEQIKAKDIQGVHWNFVPTPSSNVISKDPQTLFSLSLENPLTWTVKKDKRLTPSPDLNRGNLSLTRNRATEEDRGDYTCSLEFKNGVIINKTIHVELLEVVSSPGTEVISGQKVNLTCSTGHELPSDVKLKWFPPQLSSVSASLRSDHHPSRLTIPEVGKGDGGKWRCELWRNNARLTSAMITLKIEPKLNVWMLVIICGASVIAILICILVLILYRRRKQKMRHLRHRLCQCKNPKPKGFYRT